MVLLAKLSTPVFTRYASPASFSLVSISNSYIPLPYQDVSYSISPNCSSALQNTQEVLAEKLDVTIGYISQVERGITKISLDLLAKLSDSLSCDIAELVSSCSVGADSYLDDEIVSESKRLNGRDRRIVLRIIKMMNDE